MNGDANANEVKALEEQRADLIQKMKDLTDQVETEKRALSEDEDKEFDSMKKQVEAIDSTLEKIEQARAMSLDKHETGVAGKELTLEQKEERAFANYIRGVVSTRADENLTYSDNGAVIPTTIADRIIKRIYDICPIYQLATHYPIKGNVTIPYYDESDGTIEVAYADEFTDLTGTSAKFKSIELKGFLAGALTKISRSLINSSDFDLTNFVVNDMAEKFARWYSHEALIGTDGKVEGLKGVKLTTTLESENEIGGDDLIDLQELVPDAYQAGAIWIMHHTTRAAIRKLKDNEGRYMLNPDMTAPWGYTLLGKPVYCDDNMAEIGAGEKTIYYGDMSGLAIHDPETMDIQILNELFAAQHAIGAVGWAETDMKVENAQKIAAMIMGGEASPAKLSATATASAKKSSK